jgi:hypothetical protein
MIENEGHLLAWTYLERLIQLGGYSYNSTVIANSRPLGSGEVMPERDLMVGFDSLDHEVLGFGA